MSGILNDRPRSYLTMGSVQMPQLPIRAGDIWLHLTISASACEYAQKERQREDGAGVEVGGNREKKERKDCMRTLSCSCWFKIKTITFNYANI